MQPWFTIKTVRATKTLFSTVLLVLYDLSPTSSLADLNDWYCKLQSYKWMSVFRDPEGGEKVEKFNCTVR